MGLSRKKELRTDVGERLQNEASVMHAGMRNFQGLMIDNTIATIEYVKIERAGHIASVHRGTPGSNFQFLKRSEQGEKISAVTEFHYGI